MGVPFQSRGNARTGVGVPERVSIAATPGMACALPSGAFAALLLRVHSGGRDKSGQKRTSISRLPVESV